MKSLIPLLFACFLGCQSGTTEQGTPRDHVGDLSYQPEVGTLRIATEGANPEVTQVKLLNDRKEDSLAAATPQAGGFTLVVNKLPLREVYFLEISGRSVRKGTSGLEWTEQVPVYFEAHNAELTLNYRFFDHPGSISQAAFSIQGGSEDQALLNRWQETLNKQKAEVEGEAVQYIPGQGGFSGGGSEAGVTATDKMTLTQRFIQPDKPSVAAMFLAYSGNDHRRQAVPYSELYESAPDYIRQTKYGIDLIRRLDRIKHPIKELNLPEQVVVVDPGLKRISWSDFAEYDRMLFCFWDSMDQTAYTDVQAVNEQADALESEGTILVHVAMDNRLSGWKKATATLDLVHNYKLRNASKQPLIEALYLTNLPRYVLTRPSGEVIDADVPSEAVQELLTHR